MERETERRRGRQRERETEKQRQRGRERERKRDRERETEKETETERERGRQREGWRGLGSSLPKSPPLAVSEIPRKCSKILILRWSAECGTLNPVTSIFLCPN